jgi:general stress protein 26
MGDTKDLEREEAKKKLKEMAEGIDFCMFCTKLGHFPFDSVPMSTREVDKDGNIWFMSKLTSDKNKAIMEDNRVQLLYALPGKSHFLSVSGRAKVLKDEEKTEELWTNFAKAWFTEGKNDPELTLLKVEPESAHYWDTKHGKMIAMVIYATAAITGKEFDDGVEGQIKV